MKLITIMVLTNYLAHASESPFRILKDAYLNASMPAQVSDFDFKENITQRCVSAPDYNKGKLVEYLILRDVYYAGAISDNGPLFPGTKGEKVNILRFGEPHNIPRTDFLFKLFSIEELSSDLSVKYHLERSPKTLFIRRGEHGIIHFYEFTKDIQRSNRPKDESYGYCYPLE